MCAFVQIGEPMSPDYPTVIWSYRPDVAVSGRDIAGYDVHAADGSIGKIDESDSTVGRAHLVVDTGSWIFGKKRLIPAGVVQCVDHAERTVYLSVTKARITAAPDFDESRRDALDAYNSCYDTPD
jgi:hypothetical protein